MGRQKKTTLARGGGGKEERVVRRSNRGKNQPPAQEQEDGNDSDERSEESENFLSFDKRDTQDEDVEEEVFKLDISDSDEDDADDDEEDDDEDDLKQLVDNLPDKLRQKVLRDNGGGDDSDDDLQGDSEDDADGVAAGKWGKKRQTYWSGDTADLEIGQDVEDAEEEEEAAKELHDAKMKRMKASDFFDDDEAVGMKGSDSSDSEEDSDEELTMGKQLQNAAAATGSRKKRGAGAGEILGDLQLATLGASATDVQVEQLERTASALTKQQQQQLLAEHSPELLSIITELRDLVKELKNRIVPITELLQRIKETHRPKNEDELVEYLEVKQQLLLCYCMNVMFYLYLKSRGTSVNSHPVMKQLIKIRFVMEKMRPLDSKLKYQIDRLVQAAEISSAQTGNGARGKKQTVSSGIKPRVAELLAAAGVEDDEQRAARKRQEHDSESDDDSDDDNNDQDEDVSDEEETGETTADVYKVPKRTAVPYQEAENRATRAEKTLLKQREKLRRSELMESLREEFGSAPEEGASSGLGTKSGDLLKLQEEAREREDFEEDRFVRLTMSAKDKKSMKKRMAAASRLDNFADIGDVGDLDAISKIISGDVHGKDSVEDATENDIEESLRSFLEAGHGNAKSTSAALKRSVASMQMDAHQTSSSTEKRRRRPVPNDYFQGEAGSESGSESGTAGMDPYSDLLEDFAEKKRSFKEKKEQHYTAEPRYGGVETTVVDGEKRAVSYEIIKNRGLTPHRKKANRNPRVKKREAYSKALVRRKGQVREVLTGAGGNYAGEMTGIKANVARSRKMGV